MDFDELDDILDDNAYVPSFAPKQTKKKNYAKEQTTSITPSSSSINQLGVYNSRIASGGLLGIHKETAKRQSLTFQEVLNRQKQEQAERSMFKQTFQLNRSSSDQKLDDIGFQINSQRSSTRRPLSRGKQSTFDGQKQTQMQTTITKKNLMIPPLNKKSQSLKNEELIEQQNMIDNIQKIIKKKQKQKQKIDYDPLQNLKRDENKQIKKIYQQQSIIQKNMLNNIIQNQKKNNRQQIERIKKIYEQEIKKKLQLKNYQLQKMKQFYQLQLNIKNSINLQKKQIISTNNKIQQNLKQLKKIQIKITDQYTQIQKKQSNDYNYEMNRRQILIQKKQKELSQLQKKLSQYQKDIKIQKQRIYNDQDQQRRRLDQLSMKINKRQGQLQSKYRKRQKQLQDDYKRKRQDIDKQKQIMRYQILEFQQKKIQIQLLQTNINNKIKNFQIQHKQTLEQLFVKKTKQMQKQIQITHKLNDISFKQNQIQMERKDLINKIKILQLQKKKIHLQNNNTSLPSNFIHNQINVDKLYKTGIGLQGKNNHTGNFQHYHKTITQMKQQMMSLMPTF